MVHAVTHRAELKSASQLITTLLKDVMVHCIACKRDVKAEDYHTHECSTSPTKGEVKMASQVLCRLADTSPALQSLLEEQISTIHTYTN